MIGIPEHRALGFFSFDRKLKHAKAIKWFTKYQFSNFYADDHLSCLMFLDNSRKTLDYNFILWKFDMTKLDLRSLEKLDKAGKQEDDDDESEEEDEDEILPKTGVEKVVGSACCTLF